MAETYVHGAIYNNVVHSLLYTRNLHGQRSTSDGYACVDNFEIVTVKTKRNVSKDTKIDREDRALATPRRVPTSVDCHVSTADTWKRSQKGAEGVIAPPMSCDYARIIFYDSSVNQKYFELKCIFKCTSLKRWLYECYNNNILSLMNYYDHRLAQT